MKQPPHELRDGIHVFSVSNMPYWLQALGIINRIHSRFRFIQLAIDARLTTLKLRRLARKLNERYHFILVHGFETYIGDEAAAIARMLGIPSVFTLEGGYQYHLANFGEVVLHRAVSNMNATDRLIAVSSLAARSYREQGVERDFVIIPNGAEIESDHVRMIPKNIKTFTHNRFVLLTVGSFFAGKRIDVSVRTLARLRRNGMKNAVLLIIGTGPLKPDLLRVIEEERIGEAVRIVGEVPPKDMSSYYSIADVVVHPSIVDSFSMVCLEAMLHGKPVVCCSNIGLVEFLTPGIDALVVPPDDSEALYQAVRSLIEDASLRHRIGQRALLVAAKLSWSNQVREVERIYEEVLSE